MILGHQIVGVTDDGRRVGVPWLGWTDGECRYCTSGRENLCVNARFTGRDIDGGFAELTVADERFCLPLPDGLSDDQAAPLLCGGLIGYRALRLAGDAPRLGPLRLRLGGPHDLPGRRPPGPRGVRVHPRRRRAHPGVRPLARRDVGGQQRRAPPEQLDAAIIFASAGALVPAALRALAPGGTVVCAGIHMTDIPSFPYEDLWQERTIRSVANLTREDGTSSWRWPARCRSARRSPPTRWRRRAGARRPARRALRGAAGAARPTASRADGRPARSDAGCAGAVAHVLGL